MDKLDPGLKISLQESFGDLETTIREKITKLQPRSEYTVLVAGKVMINRVIQNLPCMKALQTPTDHDSLSSLSAMCNKSVCYQMMKSEIRDFEIFSSCTNYGAIFVSSQVLSLPLLRKNLCPSCSKAD